MSHTIGQNDVPHLINCQLSVRSGTDRIVTYISFRRWLPGIFLPLLAEILAGEIFRKYLLSVENEAASERFNQLVNPFRSV